MSTLLAPAVLDAPRTGRHLPEPATLRTLLADWDHSEPLARR